MNFNIMVSEISQTQKDHITPFVGAT
jgi:hypothetical protein